MNEKSTGALAIGWIELVVFFSTVLHAPIVLVK